MLRHVRIVSILVIALALVACGSSGSKTDPPEINYGQDMSEMGMPVSDPKFTAAVLPEDSDTWILFDDIGEFLRYYQMQQPKTQAMWVPDVNSGDWVKAEDAWYLQSDEYCYSPMKWCVAAFKDEDSARNAEQQYGGDIWNWEDVFDKTWDKPPAPEGAWSEPVRWERR